MPSLRANSYMQTGDRQGFNVWVCWTKRGMGVSFCMNGSGLPEEVFIYATVSSPFFRIV